MVLEVKEIVTKRNEVEEKPRFWSLPVGTELWTGDYGQRECQFMLRVKGERWVGSTKRSDWSLSPDQTHLSAYMQLEIPPDNPESERFNGCRLHVHYQRDEKNRNKWHPTGADLSKFIDLNEEQELVQAKLPFKNRSS